MRKIMILTSLVAAIATIAVVQVESDTAIASPSACPATFSVLHNDKIGTVTFPAGPYNMTVTNVTCSQASALFAQFLQDWDGKLPGGWSLKQSGATRTFAAVKAGKQFTATPAKSPTPAPGPTPAPSSLTCPGSFAVLHSDKIGAMSLPKGNYRINRLTGSQKITCPQASAWFAYFLNNDYAGTLPAPWTMSTSTKTFYDGSKTNGFRVIQLTGLGAILGSYPLAGESICSTTFKVGARTTISGFTVPAGNYVLSATGSSTCARAMQLASETINSADLPASWTIAKAEAWFHHIGGTYGFRLDPGASGSGSSFTG